MERLGLTPEIPDGKGIAIPHAAGTLLVLRMADQLHAYEDICPHMAVSLRWPPADFLSPDGQFILCANHQAAFRAADGVCVFGPCEGERLTRREIRVEDGVLWLL
jgi:nitrite reductase/ring-hydroxylating ferredoxin subunit